MVSLNARSVWNARFASARKRKIRACVLAAFNATFDNVKFLGPRDFAKIGSLPCSRTSLPNRISGPADFASAVAACAASGKALHLPGSPFAFAWFKEFFGAPDARILGGQAGNAANALAALGGRNRAFRVCVFPALLSPEQAALLDERVRVPVVSKGGLCFVSPARAARALDETIESWIFEFAEGAKLEVGGREFRAPRANRLIVSGESSLRPVFPRSFEPLLPQLGARLDAAFLSGYHYLRGEETLSRAAAQLSLLRSRNKRLFLHWEYVPAEYERFEKKTLFAIGGAVDELGLNEVELARVLRVLGFKRDAARIEKSGEDAENVFLGARLLLKELKLAAVQVHALGFTVIALSKACASERGAVAARDACIFASLVTCLKALKGTGSAAVSPSEVRRAPKLRVSKSGFNQLGVFASAFIDSKLEREKFLREGVADLGDCFAVVVPAPVAPAPKMTVGLGDVFSSCMLAASLAR